MSEKSTKDGLQIIYDFVTDCANAIREVEGSTGKMKGTDVPARIRSIESGVDTTDANAVAGDIRFGKTAYVNEAKVTGLLEDYDGSFEGEGFEELVIPKISITKFSPDGTLTWNAINISNTEGYTIDSITYTININELKTLTTSATSYNVKNYLRIGTNTVSISATAKISKIGPNGYATNEYTIPNLGVSTIELESTVVDGGTVAVSTNIYSFSTTGDIQKYDTVNQTIEILEAKVTIPVYASRNKVAVGTDIYIVGGRQVSGAWAGTAIQKFDTISETFTLLEISLIVGNNMGGLTAVGTDIYLMGSNGYSNNMYYIQKFDTVNNTVEQLGRILCEVAGTSPVSYGNDIYTFGGYNGSRSYNRVILKYNVVSATWTTITSFDRALSSTGTVIVDDDIYIFGGYYNESANVDFIHRFNATYEYLERLEAVLPYVGQGIPVAAVGKDIYILGYGYSVGDRRIFKFTVEEES